MNNEIKKPEVIHAHISVESKLFPDPRNLYYYCPQLWYREKISILRLPIQELE